jgi:hypothetical protein
MNYQNCDHEKTALEIVDLELGWEKQKHPDFPHVETDGISIILEKLGELSMAVNDQTDSCHKIVEAAHVAVTAIRFIEEQLKRSEVC